MSVELLTPEERDVIQATADLWGKINKAIPDGPNREADLRELVIHVHAIQRAFMSNAAGRAYPVDFRLLGESRLR